MKTLLTWVLCLTISITLSSQNTKVEITTTDAVFKSGNGIYLKKVKSKDAAIKIKKLQNMAATYNIEDIDTYNPKKKSATYDVVFEESNCKIHARYNSEGTIISTTEQFTDMKLPHSLISEIARKYPNWYFLNNIQLVNYTHADGATKIYKIQINKNREKKTLTYKMTNTATETDYVVIN